MSQTSYYFTFMYIPLRCELEALGSGVSSIKVFFSGVAVAMAAISPILLRARRDGRAPVFHTGGPGSIPGARIPEVRLG